MLKRFSLVLGTGFALLLLMGCETTRHTVHHTHVKTNPSGTVVMAKTGSGPDKVMVKSNPSGVSVKIKDNNKKH